MAFASQSHRVRGVSRDAMLRQASTLIAEGRLDAARELLEGLQRRWREDAHALHLLGLLEHRCGNSARAIGLLERAVDRRPAQTDFQLNLGLVLLDSGQPARALTALRRAALLARDDAGVHAAIGRALDASGEPAQALESLRRAAALVNDDAPLHHELADAFAAAGEPATAVRHYLKSLAIEPRAAPVWLNLAATLADAGDIGGAVSASQQALALPALGADVLIRFARLLLRLEHPELALAASERAAGVTPESDDAALLRARALMALGRHDEALAPLREVLARQPACVEARANLGICLERRGATPAALEMLREAVALSPDDPDLHFNLAVALQTHGDLEAALACHRQTLRLAPTHAATHLSVSMIRSFELDDAWLETLERHLAGDTLSAPERVNLHFAVASHHDRRDNIARAFQHYAAGNALQARLQPFDPDVYTHYVDALIDTFDADFFARHAHLALDNETPLLMVGMPRSGSSLLEQMLSRHSGCHGAGESDALRATVRALTARGTGTFPDCARQVDDRTWRALGESYLATLCEDESGAPRVIDKLLGNFLRLGLVGVMLPRARVIDCQRDPRDSGWSCFRQRFERGLRFSYDLEHLALVYHQYRRLMAHWRAVLPNPILEVRYEDLVQAPEATMAQVLDFCGLDFEPACSDPTGNPRAVRTASFWQVRQPLHTGSLGAWSRYAEHLQPLVEALGESVRQYRQGSA